MEKFTIEQYKEAKEKAIELGIKYVGVKKEKLIDTVNAKLKEVNIQNKPKKEKVKKRKAVYQWLWFSTRRYS
jgi:hypothetical protein